MIDERQKKNLTWAYYKEEREKLRKATEERIQKDKINQTNEGNKLLIFLRNILEEDIVKLFKLNEKDLLYIHRDIAILALSYFLDEDINYLDKIDIKDFIGEKSEKKLESYFKKSCKFNNKISNSYFYIKFIWRWLTKLKEQNIKKGLLNRYVDKNIIKEEKIGTIRFLLAVYLKNFFDYDLYPQTSGFKPTNYEKNNFLKHNNITKKIDYLSYVKASIISHNGFLEINTFDLESSNDNRFLCESFHPNNDYTWNEPQTSLFINALTGKEINNGFKIIKSTNLLFTGIVNSYDDKKRLISQKTYINGNYSGYGTYYNYDHYGKVLNNGKKVVTPKEEILYSHDNKICAKFKKKPRKSSEEIEDGLFKKGDYIYREEFGDVIEYDKDEKVISRWIKKNNRIISLDSFKKRRKNEIIPVSREIKKNNIIINLNSFNNTNISLNLSKSIIQEISLRDFQFVGANPKEYSLIIFNAEDEYWCGLEEGISGFGDPELIHGQDGYVNYPREEDGASSRILYNFSCQYNVIIASYDFFDELTGLSFLTKSFYEECQNISYYNTSKKQKTGFDPYKHFSLISFIPTSEKYQVLNKCIIGMNNIIDNRRLSLGKIPIFSNKIHVLEYGEFKCHNGWHPIYSALDREFVTIRLDKADPFKTLTKKDLSHLKKVSDEFNSSF